MANKRNVATQTLPAVTAAPRTSSTIALLTKMMRFVISHLLIIILTVLLWLVLRINVVMMILLYLMTNCLWNPSLQGQS